MTRWLLRRIATSLTLAFIVATIVFLTLHIVPGDPAEILLSTGGVSPDPAAVAELREKLGLEKPLVDQYLAFLGGVLHGRLRSNVVHFRSVREAAKSLGEDGVAAVMAPLGELEGALAGDTRFVIDEAKLGELNPKSWPVGMAVKADADELAAALSGALAELQQEGTVAAIFARHGVSLHSR